eukprot:scaffold2989_cov387-Prasinococcus_capsulatus_cf.AAC.8
MTNTYPQCPGLGSHYCRPWFQTPCGCRRAVVGRIPVQPSQSAGQDGNLLPAIVADHPDLLSDSRRLRSQLDLTKGHVLHVGRVEPIEAKVMYWVAIDSLERYLFPIQQHSLASDGTGLHYVAVREH